MVILVGGLLVTQSFVALSVGLEYADIELRFYYVIIIIIFV